MGNNTSVEVFLSQIARQTEQTLTSVLKSELEYPGSIHKVMRYSIFAGGKRIRPGLVMAAYLACGGKADNREANLACAALEMFHTFSLMHDDLPCMDDDDFRRGKPTAHRAFSEALAVLGGDALCIYAFGILAKIGDLNLISEIADALGTNGMIGGQVVDIESEGQSVDKETVDYIHRNKTAALIAASVRTGAILAKASDRELEKFTIYGQKIGLAFQIVDDILDETGTTEQLGKDAKSDLAKGKMTYPAAFGMEHSLEKAQALINEACEAICFLGDKANMLCDLARYVGSRLH